MPTKFVAACFPLSASVKFGRMLKLTAAGWTGRLVWFDARGLEGRQSKLRHRKKVKKRNIKSARNDSREQRFSKQ